MPHLQGAASPRGDTPTTRAASRHRFQPRLTRAIGLAAAPRGCGTSANGAVGGAGRGPEAWPGGLARRHGVMPGLNTHG